MAIKYPPTTNGLQKTLGAQLDEGEVTSVTLNNTTGLQNKAGVFVVDRIDTGGTEKSASVREYISFDGVSGSTLTGLTRGLGGGGVDQDHATGAVVEFMSDVVQQQSIIDAIVAEHSTAGVHDATKVGMLAGAQTFTGAKTFTTGLLKAVDVTSGAGVSTLPTTTGTLLPHNPTAATYTPATGSQTVALDVSTKNMHFVTGHASGTAITFTITGATFNQPFIVSILQGGVVSTIAAWFATIRWAGGSAPTLTATINKRDTFGFIRTGTDTYDGFVVGANC